MSDNNPWRQLDTPEGKEKNRFQYLTGDFDAFISNQVYKMPLAYPTHVLRGSKDNPESIKIEWTFDLLLSALRPIVNHFKGVYGGPCELILDDHRKIPIPYEKDDGSNRRKVEVAIFNGPDNPGKRFLQRIKAVARSLDIPEDIKSQKPRKDSIIDDVNVPF